MYFRCGGWEIKVGGYEEGSEAHRKIILLSGRTYEPARHRNRRYTTMHFPIAKSLQELYAL